MNNCLCVCETFCRDIQMISSRKYEKVGLLVVELQNNRVLTYEGCFGFHRVANAKESKLYKKA